MVGAPICLAEDCEYYMSPRSCRACLMTDEFQQCAVCSTTPAIPIYHRSPDPFEPVDNGTCTCCEEEGVWINRESICRSCNKLPVTRQARVQYLCLKHAKEVKALCINGHILTGNYVTGTLICKECSTKKTVACLGCSKDFPLKSGMNQSICPTCVDKINRNICTSCNKSTVDSYVDERGYCDTCSEEYK